MKKFRSFHKENTLFFKESAFLPKELRPFPKENSSLLGEVVFFIKEFLLLHDKLAWDGTYFFAQGSYFVRETN
jgi:hypothetical protein